MLNKIYFVILVLFFSPQVVIGQTLPHTSKNLELICGFGLVTSIEYAKSNELNEKNLVSFWLSNKIYHSIEAGKSFNILYYKEAMSIAYSSIKYEKWDSENINLLCVDLMNQDWSNSYNNLVVKDPYFKDFYQVIKNEYDRNRK